MGTELVKKHTRPKGNCQVKVDAWFSKIQFPHWAKIMVVLQDLQVARSKILCFPEKKEKKKQYYYYSSFMTFIVSSSFVSTSFQKSTSFILLSLSFHWSSALSTPTVFFFFQRYTDTTVCVTELGKAWLFGSKCMLCRTEICEKFIYQENQWPNWEYEFHLNGGYTL